MAVVQRAKRGRKPYPRCVLCGYIKQQHHPGAAARDCPTYVAPDPEAPVSADAVGESPTTSTATRARERTPFRGGAISAVKQKRVKSVFATAVTAVGGGQYEFLGQNHVIPGLAHMFAPNVWTDEDILRANETALLVEGVYLEMEALFPKALRWLAEQTEASVHLQFMWAVATVAVPRLERRGLVPPGTSFFFTVAPLSVGTGGAPVDHRPDRNGQEHADGVAAAAVVVPDGGADQVRQPDGSRL